MKYTITDEIMKQIDFEELETRELNNNCDFQGTLENYRHQIKEMLKSGMSSEEIIKEIQEEVDNDYSCLGDN